MFSFFATVEKLQIFTYCFFYYKEKGYEHSRFFFSCLSYACIMSFLKSVLNIECFLGAAEF